MIELHATSNLRARWVAARVNLGDFFAEFDDPASNYLALLNTVVTQAAGRK